MLRQIRTTIFLYVFCASAWSQDFRATITGQVTDPSRASVPNATVKATNVGTNESSETRTNADGYYALPYLNPGTYNIEVAAEGFASLKRESIILRVADKLNLPLMLQVGQMTQEVTVVGQQEVIQTATADRGLNFDPIKTQEYPLNGRQSYMLMALTPGVLFTQEQFGANGFSGTRGWDTNGSYSIKRRPDRDESVPFEWRANQCGWKLVSNAHCQKVADGRSPASRRLRQRRLLPAVVRQGSGSRLRPPGGRGWRFVRDR